MEALSPILVGVMAMSKEHTIFQQICDLIAPPIQCHITARIHLLYALLVPLPIILEGLGAVLCPPLIPAPKNTILCDLHYLF